MRVVGQEVEEVATMTQGDQALEFALAAAVGDVGLELVDIEFLPGLVRVSVDRDGGVDLEWLSVANRAVSTLLDELDPISGRYILEVSSPGIERRLRTPSQFARALGQKVSVRLVAGSALRRLEGTLDAADDQGIRIVGSPEAESIGLIAYDRIDRARTVFEWGPAPAPSPSKGKHPRAERKK